MKRVNRSSVSRARRHIGSWLLPILFVPAVAQAQRVVVIPECAKASLLRSTGHAKEAEPFQAICEQRRASAPPPPITPPQQRNNAQQQREQMLAQQQQREQAMAQQQQREQAIAQQQQRREQIMAQQQQQREQIMAQQQQREQAIAQQQRREQIMAEREQMAQQRAALNEQRREQIMAQQRREQMLAQQRDPALAPRGKESQLAALQGTPAAPSRADEAAPPMASPPMAPPPMTSPPMAPPPVAPSPPGAVSGELNESGSADPSDVRGWLTSLPAVVAVKGAVGNVGPEEAELRRQAMFGTLVQFVKTFNRAPNFQPTAFLLYAQYLRETNTETLGANKYFASTTFRTKVITAFVSPDAARAYRATLSQP